jgi:hypothetical protein
LSDHNAGHVEIILRILRSNHIVILNLETTCCSSFLQKILCTYSRFINGFSFGFRFRLTILSTLPCFCLRCTKEVQPRSFLSRANFPLLHTSVQNFLRRCRWCYFVACPNSAKPPFVFYNLLSRLCVGLGFCICRCCQIRLCTSSSALFISSFFFASLALLLSRAFAYATAARFASAF